MIWRRNYTLCPRLKDFITSFKDDVMNQSVNISTRKFRVVQNISRAERNILRTVQGLHVGFNNSDKNFGPVLYSRDLYVKQCLLHLRDDKGTYRYTKKPKDLILDDFVQRLKNLVHDCFGYESATKSLARTLTKWADDSLTRGRLSKFYVMRKLHKQANAQGVRSRPIASNIGYPTGQISHFLHSQLKDSVYNHQHVLRDSLSLILLLESMPISMDRNNFLTSADVVALYPSIDIQDGIAALQ